LQITPRNGLDCILTQGWQGCKGQLETTPLEGQLKTMSLEGQLETMSFGSFEAAQM
jgi:hypothetical protein